jgi:hypothetical protein
MLNLCVLCNAIENFCGLRKFFVELKYSNRGIDSRQGAKYAKFGRERRIILDKLFIVIL